MTGTEKHANVVELPANTAWPLVFALGIALVMTGFIMSAAMSIAGGVVALGAAIGWWRQVLPAEHHHTVAVTEEALLSPAEVPEVERIRIGTRAHRTRVEIRIRPISAGLKGGLVGAIGMAGVAMFFGFISEGSIWYPVNLLAAAAVSDLASASAEQLRQFSATGLVVGAVIHLLTSWLVGVVYAVMLPMFPRRAFWWAGVSAPIVWSGVIASGLELINPALNSRIDWKWFVASQLAFGLTGGYVIARSEAIETLEEVPLALRAGIEAPGLTDSHDKPDAPAQ